MTTNGGDWKEMGKAATDGNLFVLRYYLDRGIDPNFQHPEYMTTPLLEAIRAGALPAVTVLLEHTNSADPTIAGNCEGQTPLELAMELKHHDIVDKLLPLLLENDEKEYQTVLMSGTYHRDLLERILNLGHGVLVVVPTPKEAEDCASFMDTLRNETGNKKLWFHCVGNVSTFLKSTNKVIWTPSKINVWLHKIASDQSPVPDLSTCWKELDLNGSSISRILLLFESSSFLNNKQTQKQVLWLLQATEGTMTCTKSYALVEPSSWWDTMTYCFWYQTWCDSVANLLGLSPSTSLPGKAYSYKLKSLPLPNLEAVDEALVNDWKERLQASQE
mmetsp:Transcript_32432/g.66294  ORF Transcript_32432/g.66294 Transcript_32432/m.66294 type:complete len:331 (-) Transcript_32432:261-1253(-)